MAPPQLALGGQARSDSLTMGTGILCVQFLGVTLGWVGA